MLFKCIVVSVVALKGKAFPMQVLQLCSSNGGMVSLAKVLQLCWGGGAVFSQQKCYSSAPTQGGILAVRISQSHTAQQIAHKGYWEGKKLATQAAGN